MWVYRGGRGGSWEWNAVYLLHPAATVELNDIRRCVFICERPQRRATTAVGVQVRGGYEERTIFFTFVQQAIGNSRKCS